MLGNPRLFDESIILVRWGLSLRGTGSICYYWKLLYYYYLLFVICYYLLLFYVHATAGSSLTFILVISSCCFVKNLNCWFFIKFVSLVLLWDDDCKEVCETWIVLFCCSFYWNLDGLLSLWMGQDEKAVLFGRRKKKSQMWNGPNKAPKEHNYQQLARKDVLACWFVTLDTSHLLMSVLNEEAPTKAVVFGRRKKKGSDVKWTK